MRIGNLMFTVIMLIIFPIFIISSNHNLFFIILSIVLIASSFKSIYTGVFRKMPVSFENDKELISELEELTNLDFKKFGTGIKIAKNLIIILFFLYCIVYASSLLHYIFISLIIIYWIKDSFLILWSTKNLTNYYLNKIYSYSGNNFLTIVNILMLIIIFDIFYSKFINNF